MLALRLFFTVRPGEKLFEELSIKGEDMTKTHHPKIYIGKIASLPIEEVEAGLTALGKIVNEPSNKEVRDALQKMVPEMRVPDEVEPHSAFSVDPPFPAKTIH